MMQKKKVVILFMSVCACMAMTYSAFAAPRPDFLPREGVWQLDIEFHGAPRLISVRLPGDEEPTLFWYLLYTVTNRTGQEINFYPQFELMTDTFKIVPAGRGVRRPVFHAIRDIYENAIPLLEQEAQVTGPILLGIDNARDSVAIFEDFDPNATQAKIFISGLSNETVKVELPTPINSDEKMIKDVLLRKALMLEYQVPGDRYTLENRVMLYRGRKWIMR